MTETHTVVRPTRRAAAIGSVATAFALAAPAVLRAQAVEIEYWQYFFKERVEAMDALIAQFEAANPGVKVKHTHFPYAQYRTKTAAAVPAGEGPTVMQLFFGWMREYAKSKLIQPLPAAMFNPADIDREYFDFVRLMRTSDGYWAVPTAVRSLGLFYNKKLLGEAGVPGAKPPATLDEMVRNALAATKRDGSGNLMAAGATIGIPSQDYHWWREVLVRQFGGKAIQRRFPSGDLRERGRRRGLRLVHGPAAQAQGRCGGLPVGEPGGIPGRQGGPARGRLVPARDLQERPRLRVGRGGAAHP